MTLDELADVCGTDKGAHQGFMPWYERYLPGPDAPIALCELGVYKGESLRLWRRHFRNKYAWILGVDIDLSHVDRDGDSLHFPEGVWVYEGDQVESAKRWKRWLFNVVIDDASHISSKTIGSFEAWWPLVAPGGLYVVEDTHCSYDIEFYGPASASTPEMDTYGSEHYRQPRTTMAYLKRLADDVNWNIHGYKRFTPLHEDVAFVHFYPGICFIGKKELGQ